METGASGSPRAALGQRASGVVGLLCLEDQGQKVNWRKVLGGPGSFKVSGAPLGEDATAGRRHPTALGQSCRLSCSGEARVSSRTSFTCWPRAAWTRHSGPVLLLSLATLLSASGLCYLWPPLPHGRLCPMASAIPWPLLSCGLCCPVWPLLSRGLCCPVASPHSVLR